MTASSSGAMAGLLGGLGVLLVASWLAARRAPRLMDRIGPFVGLPESAVRSRGPGDVLLLLSLASSRAPRTGGEDRDLAIRLRRSGLLITPTEYRLERVVWSALAAGAGFAVAVGLAAGGSSPVGVVLLSAAGAVAGWSLRDAALRRSTRSRQRTIERQLPGLADLLALAVSAGAAPMAALEFASMTGPLGSEVAVAVDEVRSGRSVDGALRALADRIDVAGAHRLVEGILVALERGTPLAEVLRAQAVDAWAADRRRLMEIAGRKDVLMLVPIVFLVLPSVVLIAVYPGVQSLSLVVP